ncbi:MAG: hypothetical protein AB1480_12505 [Nitrospirota bacterium]
MPPFIVSESLSANLGIKIIEIFDERIHNYASRIQNEKGIVVEQNPLEKYIATLTPEEREKHNALIQECLEREGFINKYTVKTRNSLFQLILGLEKFNKAAADFEKCAKIYKDLYCYLFYDLIPLLKTLSRNKPSMN